MKFLFPRNSLLLIFGSLLLITEFYEILPESDSVSSKMFVEATLGVGVIGTGPCKQQNS